MKLPPQNLNSSLFSIHFTNTYTYQMTIIPKVCDDIRVFFS